MGKRMKWDLYECEKDHLIIVERKEEWNRAGQRRSKKRPDDVQDVFLCDVCREVAYYAGSVSNLSDVPGGEIRKVK